MRPLEGIKVVDLTTYLAAPTTVRVLGEWGADCVKIESAKGDPARTQGAVFNMPYNDDENLAFDVANLNKKFITLNLKDPKGLEIAYRLLAEADVFVTNTRTKSLKKLGLDYDTLNEKFPKLIFAQVLGYGLFTGGLGAHYGVENLGATVIPASTGNTEKHVRHLSHRYKRLS